MLWLKIQAKPNVRSGKHFIDRCLARLPAPTIHSRHLEVELYLHGEPQPGYVLAQLKEFLRLCRFDRSLLWKRTKNKLIPWLLFLSFSVLAFLSSLFILLSLATRNPTLDANRPPILDLTFSSTLSEFANTLRTTLESFHQSGYLTLPNCPGGDTRDNLCSLPKYWWLHTGLALVTLFIIWAFLAWNKRLTRIHLYFLVANEPFPFAAPHAPNCHTLAIRILHPNPLHDVNSLLNLQQSWVLLSDRPSPYPGQIQKMSQEEKRRLRLQLHIGPIARLALALSVSDPKPDPSEDGTSPHYVPPRVLSQSFRFLYKLHVPQLRAYILLIIISILSAVAHPFGPLDKSQYVLILSAMGFMWAYWSITVHKKEFAALCNWEPLNTRTPFESSPIFLLDHNADGKPRWIALNDSDFKTKVVDYSLDKQRLLDLLLGLMLVLLFTMLQLVK